MKTRYFTGRRAQNRYLVRDRDRRLLRELARVAVAVLVMGVALLGYTSLHLASIEAGYRIDDLEKSLKELRRHERHLSLERAYLSSPARIANRAEGELGMRPPKPTEVVFVEDETPP